MMLVLEGMAGKESEDKAIAGCIKFLLPTPYFKVALTTDAKIKHNRQNMHSELNVLF